MDRLLAWLNKKYNGKPTPKYLSGKGRSNG